MNKIIIIFVIMICNFTLQNVDDQCYVFKYNRYIISNLIYNNTLHLEPFDKISFAIENKDSKIVNFKLNSDNNKVLMLSTYDCDGVNKKYKALNVNIKESITYVSVVNTVNETNIITVELNEIKLDHNNKNKLIDQISIVVNESGLSYVLQYYVTICLILFVLTDNDKGYVRKLIMISFIIIELIMNPYIDVVRKFIYLIVKL